MLGTKWPSITSTCSIRHPALSSASTCSPKRAKSAERMEGRISTMHIKPYHAYQTLPMRRLFQGYHSREKAISGLSPGQAHLGFQYRQTLHRFFVFLTLQ